MASVIAESCVGARNTVRADACPVDRIHPKKKRFIATVACVPRACVGPVEECIAVASEVHAVEALGIGGPI
jgi:hypothetical protein